MFLELPQNLIFSAIGAFVVGWVIASIYSRLGAKKRALARDPRDDRIRSLEAELRISRSQSETSKSDAEVLEEQLKETTIGIERRDDVISKQQTKLNKVSTDLKDSVLKTRELRTELTDRATENVHAEAKIREVETELSVAQASTDMIATGVLDYSLAPEKEFPDGSNDSNNSDNESGKVSKASS